MVRTVKVVFTSGYEKQVTTWLMLLRLLRLWNGESGLASLQSQSTFIL